MAIERTRALIARRLGVALEAAPRDAYRELEALEGDWIGAFAQPGVILHAATVVRATLGEHSGRAVDEYGQSELEIVEHDAERVVLRKRYAGKSITGEFVYIGRLVDGTLAGYWFSPLRPPFCGVCWMSRADRLTDATRTALDQRVRSRSVRRGLVYATLGVLGATGLAGLAGHAGFALLTTVAVLTGGFLLADRTNAMRREVKLWQRALGSG